MRINRLPLSGLNPGKYWDKLTDKLGGPDKLNDHLYRAPWERWRAKVLFNLLDDCGELDTCLELGCAAGLLTKQLAARFNHVTAVDASETLLSAAPQLDNVDYLLQDIDRAEFLPAAVGFMSEILEHLRFPEKVINRCQCEWIVASVPLDEEISDRAFSLSAYDGDIQQVEDGSGHRWAWDMEGFLAHFDRFEIVRSGRLWRYGIVLARSKK